jgi:hypothetical protein
MSNNPFAGWKQADVEAHNQRVALARMKGNPVNDLFEQQQRERVNALLTNITSGTPVPPKVEIAKNGRRKVTIGGKTYSFRSHWEVNYAYYLEFLKQRGDIAGWLYEDQVFYFDGIRRGTTNYTPDFKVIFKDGRHEWREVKGWLDPKSKTKLKRMKKYFPKEIVRLIDSNWFKANSSNLAAIVPGWSKKNR